VAGDRWHSLPRPCDRQVDGISKRNHRVWFAGHGAVRLSQNDIWVERWIRTVLSESLYVEAFASSAERELALARFVSFYNEARPHLGLGGETPRQRLAVKLAA
jgi:putative transposase